MASWPERYDLGQSRNFNLDVLHHKLTQFRDDPDIFKSLRDADEWVLGYAIPPFQRALVWSDEQKERFLESAVLGLPLGSFTYNCTMHAETVASPVDGRPIWFADMWLLDGLQRLSAIQDFFDDKFTVFDRYFSDLDEVECRKFLSRTRFDANETHLTDEAQLRDLYDRMNFGGTAHTLEDRATMKL